MQPSTAAETSAQRTSWPSFSDFSFIKGLDGPASWPVPASARAPEPPRRTVRDARLRRLARHLHLLGERSVYELLREIIGGRDSVERLEVYARLDADIVAAIGGDRLPSLRPVQ
jgi:hypothetical protein